MAQGQHQQAAPLLTIRSTHRWHTLQWWLRGGLWWTHFWQKRATPPCRHAAVASRIRHTAPLLHIARSMLMLMLVMHAFRARGILVHGPPDGSPSALCCTVVAAEQVQLGSRAASCSVCCATCCQACCCTGTALVLQLLQAARVHAVAAHWLGLCHAAQLAPHAGCNAPCLTYCFAETSEDVDRGRICASGEALVGWLADFQGQAVLL